jgi:translin
MSKDFEEPRAVTESLSSTTRSIITRFEAMSAARDQAVTESRQVVRLAANAIRALHRGERDGAAPLLKDAQGKLEEIRAATERYPEVYWAGYVQDAMKEVAEAQLTAAILNGAELPSPDDLQVEDAAYLNGLAEAASELRRDILDALRRNDTERALELMDAMDGVYAALVTVDFPDAVTGGLRRTTDQLRAVLERTRGDVTVAVRQDRLERALQAVELRLREGE